MKTITRSLIIAVLVTTMTASRVTAQAPTAATVADRERPAIQAVLEGLLAAERAQDPAAIRRCITRGTAAAWDRYVKEKSLDLIPKELSQIEITWLAVGSGAQWAMATLKKGSGTINLRREDGAWKVDGEDDAMLAFWVGFAMGPKAPSPRPPAQTLPPLILTDADLPSGWKTELQDEKYVFMDSCYSYVTEAVFVNLKAPRPDGKSALMGKVKYHLVENADLATWLLWRQSQFSRASAWDFRGNSLREVTGDGTVTLSDSNVAWNHIKKGRIFVTILIDRTVVPTANMTAGKIADKVLARLP